MRRVGASIVDVGDKAIVSRVATAEGTLRLAAKTVKAIRDGRVPKGDVLEVARTAALMAVKNTPNILPLTHIIPLEGATVDFKLGRGTVRATCTVRAHWKTGVEMEALTGVAAALLTVWDLVKPLEKDGRGQYPSTVLEGIRVVKKVKGP